ncbi:MAG: O-antigen ligase family protein [Pseudomonadota bacterium]
MVTSSLSALLICFELITGGMLYSLIRRGSEEDGVHLAVFNRGSVFALLLFLASFFLYSRKDNKLIYLLFMPFIALLFLTQSQSVQIGFVFAILFYLLFPFKNQIALSVAFALFAVHALILPFVMPAIYDAVPYLGDTPILKSGFANHRLEIWDFISQKIQTNPWVGHGLEFTRGYEGFQPRGIYFHWDSILHPHNFVLQVWIELGVIGVLFLISFVCFLMLEIRKMEHSVQKSALAILFTLLLLNSFSYGLWQSWWLGFMFIISGLFLLVSYQSRDYKEEGANSSAG